MSTDAFVGAAVDRLWVEAATETGLATNDDFNGERQDGVGLYQVTQKNGMRWSTAAAFLRPALERGNLTLETGLTVHRLLIERGRALGVAGMRAAGEPF